ncbi:MAG TPA: class I SAM-dependent methyltransferase [Reyranella sp.]|nr:class I SAM-dependent methyltransferase [Reyranella sp.]
MHIDPVWATELCPALVLHGRRAVARLTGRLYYFNGQKNRARVFHAIDERVPFENYVETGTYLGMTTDFLARTAARRGARVYSCELDGRCFAIARRTAGRRANVQLHHGDSVGFLTALLPQLASAVNFVYLDAHGAGRLPLREELALLRECPNSVIMIDDFRVPSDPRFGWDRYDDREICLDYIADMVGGEVWLPGYPATHEEATWRGEASPRGYCVIAQTPALRDVLDGVPLLRRGSIDHARATSTIAR